MHAARVAGTVAVISLAAMALMVAQSWRASASATSAHQFDFISIEGDPMPMSGFAGKAVLVVNTASFCGFTPQYRALQALYDQYRDQGLVVLGVPSNDFGRQEPGSSEEIQAFCETNYGIDFPMTERQVVSGAKAHPFYRWAKAELGSEARPRWNFHKILIDRNGAPVSGFATSVKPDSPRMVKAIEAVLAR